MVRVRDEEFKGRVSDQVLGTPWIYTMARALGFITDPGEILRITSDPLAIEVMATYRRLSATGMLPIGPRGIGYILLGTTIDGKLVIKTKRKLEVPSGRTSRSFKGDFIDFEDVGNTIVALRRCRRNRIGTTELPFTWVADGRSDKWTPRIAVNAEAVRIWNQNYSKGYAADVLHDQDVYVECWVEAAGLLQVVGNILGHYGIEVYSGSGDVPHTALRHAAGRFLRALREARSVVVPIVGDFDFDGIGNADRLVEDIERLLPARYQDEIEWRWVAPTEEQLLVYRADLGPAVGPPEIKRVHEGKDDEEVRELPMTMQAEGLLRSVTLPDGTDGDSILRIVLIEAIEGQYDEDESAILDMAMVDASHWNWRDVEQPGDGPAVDPRCREAAPHRGAHRGVERARDAVGGGELMNRCEVPNVGVSEGWVASWIPVGYTASN
jgi:hypothetical protein